MDSGFLIAWEPIGPVTSVMFHTGNALEIELVEACYVCMLNHGINTSTCHLALFDRLPQTAMYEWLIILTQLRIHMASFMIPFPLRIS